MGSATRVPNSAAALGVPLGPTECLASWDRSITPSAPSRASFPTFVAGDVHSPLKLVLRCMRQVGLDRMCMTFVSLAFVSLFDRGAFLRPDHDCGGAPRTATVKAGRRAFRAMHRSASRPRLDGGEHG